MKNPWKRLSKINPQPEDGTRRINIDVWDALIRAKLPTAEMGVVMVILRQSWGFGKHSDAIPTSQFVEATGLTGRAIKKARAALVAKRIIVSGSSKRVKRGSPFNEYLFNKHYDTWKTRDKKKGERMFTGERKGKKRVNGSTPSIDTISIENLNADFDKSADEVEKEKFYRTAKKRKLKGKRLDAFNRFWDVFNLKQGKAAAADSWLDIPELTNTIVDDICSAASIEAERRQSIIDDGGRPKWAQGWITERRWEDEIYQASPEPEQPPQPSIEDLIS